LTSIHCKILNILTSIHCIDVEMITLTYHLTSNEFSISKLTDKILNSSELWN